jgi:DNA-binding SARP family transcriptional activator/DNA-binding beta-propeller fold protein YncE
MSSLCAYRGGCAAAATGRLQGGNRRLCSSLPARVTFKLVYEGRRALDFRILGPLKVYERGRPLPLGGIKQRALLALLILHRNEVVSTDRLIDDLWGNELPSRAVKTLQVSVSRLRKALGGDGANGSSVGPLLTRDHGYLLRVEPEQLDLDRFRRLLEEGRHALADGNAETAARTLREALDLWRGPPLADLAYESFAQPEIRGLEELRLAAVEDRIDADLALGRHADLLAELEAVVAKHPLRERLRGQLMLALYRCGRQAEALDVYQRGRRALAEELGLEPSPALRELESAILARKPNLELPSRVAKQPVAARLTAPASGRRRRLLLAGVLLLTAAVSATVYAFTHASSGTALDRVPANSIGLIDPKSNRIAAAVPVGNAPSSAASGEGAIWVLNADDRTVSKIEPKTRRLVRTFAINGTPIDLAAGAGALWVSIGSAPRGSGQVGYTVADAVARLDVQSSVIVRTIRLPRAGSISAGFPTVPGLGQSRIAVADGAVWVVDPDLTVSRIDPGTNKVVATIRRVAAGAIAAGPKAVWISGLDGTVSRIDPRRNAVTASHKLAATSLNGIAAGDGVVWVADAHDGTLWRLDPGPRSSSRRSGSARVLPASRSATAPSG